ncbi:hypothetical protein [Acetobacter conturbans]|uniref:Uncharacterized protein n=1 Tax=Acetobacter conturbans TaxID=1737472 RepID=A0ABX0JY70_9PROT|nr:hypothetical protein [Acetobacter conturbans]NHN87400.1 hypothetical protein [Acetobacter conturbans]
MSEYTLQEVKDSGGTIVRWEIYFQDELMRSFTDQAKAEEVLAELRSKEKSPSL